MSQFHSNVQNIMKLLKVQMDGTLLPPKSDSVPSYPNAILNLHCTRDQNTFDPTLTFIIPVPINFYQAKERKLGRLSIHCKISLFASFDYINSRQKEQSATDKRIVKK
jgi:hypothetical protein